jgi:hypothetical protein
MLRAGREVPTRQDTSTGQEEGLATIFPPARASACRDAQGGRSARAGKGSTHGEMV